MSGLGDDGSGGRGNKKTTNLSQNFEQGLDETLFVFEDPEPPPVNHQQKPVVALDLIDQELTRKPGAPVGNQFASKEHKTNTDNISNCLDDHKRNESHGTSIEYTLRRLRKDHPELHEKVLARLLLMAANPPTKAAISLGTNYA